MDWQLLGMEVARQLNLAQGDVAATPQAGGDINRAFRFELGARSFFVKTNRAELLPMFEAERVGLETISATKTIRVPEVYLAGCQGDRAYIVMEYIELGGRADPGQLASALAAMHAAIGNLVSNAITPSAARRSAIAIVATGSSSGAGIAWATSCSSPSATALAPG
jgi:fructosamine-3-kinase